MSVERVHWLRSEAQLEWWMEEQNSIHNEAKWIPAYFHAKAETWRKLMHIAAEGSLKEHQAYASYQMHAWEELSQSSSHSLTPITKSPIKHYKVESILLAWLTCTSCYFVKSAHMWPVHPLHKFLWLHLVCIYIHSMLFYLHNNTM